MRYLCCPPFLNNFCPALFKRVRHIFKQVRHFFKPVRHFFKQVRQLFKHVRHFFKHNFYSNCPPFGMSSGGVLITAIFGVSTASTMLKDSFDILLQSRAGEHDITKHEGHEQL